MYPILWFLLQFIYHICIPASNPSHMLSYYIKRLLLLSAEAVIAAAYGNGVYALIHQPLTAPAVIPSIKYLWKQRNTTNTGIIPNMEPAIKTS